MRLLISSLIIFSLVLGQLKLNAQIPTRKEFLLNKIYGNYSKTIKRSKWVCTDKKLLKEFNLEISTELLARVAYVDSVENMFYVFTESAPKDFNCHPCAPIISISVLTKVNGDLVLKFTKHFEVLGGFGRAAEIRSLKFSKSNYSFIINPGFTGQGFTTESLNFYILENENVKKVFEFPNSLEDNEGICDNKSMPCYKYETIVSPISNEGYFDLKLNKRGTLLKRDKVIKFDSVFTYRYSRNFYSLIK